MLHACVLQSCPTLCDPMDCSPPGSSVQGILQARILEWVALPSSRGSSSPRDRTCISCIVDGFFSTEPQGKPWHDPKEKSSVTFDISWELQMTPDDQVSGVFSWLPPPNCLLCPTHLLGKMWFKWWEQVAHGLGQAPLGCWHRVSEARGLSEEVLSVLKAAGFVFTENHLQALLPRTLGTTHLWDVRVAPGSCTVQGQWARGAGSMLSPFEIPGGLLWFDAWIALFCREGALHKFTRYTPSPWNGTWAWLVGGILTNTLLLKHRIKGVLPRALLRCCPIFLHALTHLFIKPTICAELCWALSQSKPLSSR